MRYRLASVCVALLGLLVVAPAVSRAQPKPAPKAEPKPASKPEPKPASKAEPKLELSTRKPRPGDPILITVTGTDRPPRGAAGRVQLIFFPVKHGWQAIFAMPLEDTQPDLKIVLSEPKLSETLPVTPRTWAEEQVKIDPEMAEPPADKRKLIDKDNLAIIEAIRDHGPPRFSAVFASPGNGTRTSTFGAWRTLNGGYRSRHLGLDFAARKGAEVRTVQDGEVALVSSGFLTGGTVVVVHGAGIASTYFHLDDIKVAAGDKIKRGTVLGKVGMTGRTTGPHIHLGIWVPGGFIDPDTFLRLRIGPPVTPVTAVTPAHK